MTHEAIFEKICDLVRTNFRVNEALHWDCQTKDIEGWDSFGTMRMVMDVESAFSVEIPIAAIPHLDSLGKIAEFVAAEIGERKPQ